MSRRWGRSRLGEHKHDLWALQADGVQIDAGKCDELLVSGLGRRDPRASGTENLPGEADLDFDLLDVGAGGGSSVIAPWRNVKLWYGSLSPARAAP